MEYNKTIIPKLVDKGLDSFSQDMLMATKRKGKWVKTGKEDFEEKVRHFALGLYELGIRKGDHVSIHAENSTEWVICDQAILSLGAANVPIFTTLPGEQIEFVLEKSDAKVHIVSNDALFKETKPLIKKIKSIKAIISLFGSKHEKLHPFKSILLMGKNKEKEEPKLFERLKAAVQPDDLATLIYTSGTTGDPKGVMLSHHNISSNVVASLDRVPFDMKVDAGQQMLSYLPLSHVFERLIIYLYLRMGYPVYFIDDIEDIRDDFETVKPYFFSTVPRLLEKIYTGIKVKGQELSGIKKRLYYWALDLAKNYDPENPPIGLKVLKCAVADKLVYSKIRELFGGNLTGMINGGAALSPDLFRFFNAMEIYCGQGYGLTETSPVVSVTDSNHMRVGSSGTPLSNVQVKIAEDDEILVKGPNVMLGYYKNEEKTQGIMTSDGWLKTGDVGKLEDGYLFITDRIKSVFKLSTGKYIAPQTIETQLGKSGFIDQAVVLGYQQKFCSALIVPDFGNISKRLGGDVKPEGVNNNEKVRNLIQKEVDKVNKHLSPWEQVKKFVLLEQPFTIDSGELTPTLKAKRPVINEHYKEEIASIYDEEAEATETSQ